MKDQIYETIAQAGKALSSPKRLELLDVLCQGEKTVEWLAEHTAMGMKLTSAHLRVLRGARLVETRKEGKQVYYRIAGPDVASLWVSLRSLAERLFSAIDRTMEQFFRDKSDMSRLDRKTLLRRVRAGEVVVIDVRPEEEYFSGHFPSALSIPVADLKKRLSEIPKNRVVVAYCRGPYCVLSHEAVGILKTKGYRAFRMSEGVSDWVAAGLSIERGRGA